MPSPNPHLSLSSKPQNARVPSRITLNDCMALDAVKQHIDAARARHHQAGPHARCDRISRETLRSMIKDALALLDEMDEKFEQP